MVKKESRNERRKWRHRKMRKKIFGTPGRPRLCPFRSLKHIYVQIIDDEEGKTLAAASTLELKTNEKLKQANKTELAKLVGELIAKKAKEKGIEKVVFDRAGYLYHGRIKALAEAARQAGLQF